VVTDTVQEPAEPRAALRLPSLVLLVVASMIGFGVFTSSGFGLLSLGSPQRVLLAWFLAGLWAISGAVAYGGLARRVPLSGGEYVYLSRLMHPAIGFLAGWISLIAGFTAPIAGAAKAVVAFGFPEVTNYYSQSLIASSMILLAGLCHASRLGLGLFVQSALVALKLLLFVVLFGWAFLAAEPQRWQGVPATATATSIWPENFTAWQLMFSSMAWFGFSYTGFNAAIYVAGQSHAAQRNVPRAMLIATLVVMVIYLAVNVIFVYAPDPASVAERPEAIAAVASLALGGPALERLVRAIITVAVLGSVFSMLLVGPRVYWQMARDGVMPRWFDTSQEVPRAAIAVQTAISIVVVWLGTLEQLIGYLGLTLSACSALAIASLWVLPTRGKKLAGNGLAEVDARPLHWYEWLATAIYIPCTLLMILATVGLRTEQLVAAAATFVVGGVVYLVWQTVESPPTRYNG
jgi:amino acid transporter